MTWGLIEKDDIAVPCPFCGKVDLIMISRDRDENYVSCQNCMGEGPISETPESALARWNKRTDVSIQDSQVSPTGEKGVPGSDGLSGQKSNLLGPGTNPTEVGLSARSDNRSAPVGDCAGVSSSADRKAEGACTVSSAQTPSKDYANGNHPDPYKRADAGECDAHGSTVIDGECGFCPPDRTSVWTPAETTQTAFHASSCYVDKAGYQCCAPECPSRCSTIQVTKPSSEMKSLIPEVTNSKDCTDDECTRSDHRGRACSILKPIETTQTVEQASHEWQQAWTTHLEGFDTLDLRDAFKAGAEWWYRNARWTQEEIDEAGVRAKEMMVAIGEGDQGWRKNVIEAFRNGAEWQRLQATPTATSETLEEFATKLANESAQPILRSMYPSRSRGQMANEFRHFILCGAEWQREQQAPADYEDLKRQLAAAVEYGKTFKLAWEEVVKKTTEQLVHEVDEGYCNTCDNEAEMGKCYSGKASEMDSKQHGRTARNGSVASTGPVDYSPTTLGAPEQENLKIAEEVSKEARLAFVEWKKTRGERTPLGCFAAGYVSRPDNSKGDK